MENPYIATQDNFCEGLWATPSNQCILGINYAVAKTKKQFFHDGSTVLDQTNAFDLAEIDNANLGQINLIKVSSFCGPGSLIWGYDIAKAERITLSHLSTALDNEISIYCLDPLADAFKQLTGTVAAPRFPFFPGSHVPCAAKSIIKEGDTHIYVAQGLAIPFDREKNACLLMEDFGNLPKFIHNKRAYTDDILLNLARSILQIGQNQQVNYKECWLGIKDLQVGVDEVGCALAADPYLKIAKKAFIKGIDKISIDQWSAQVEPIDRT